MDFGITGVGSSGSAVRKVASDLNRQKDETCMT
jgi:hypothetical protein